MQKQPKVIQKQYRNDSMGEAELQQDREIATEQGTGVYQFPNGKTMNAGNKQAAHAAVRMQGSFVRKLEPHEQHTALKVEKISIVKEVEFLERERDAEIKKLEEEGKFKEMDAVHETYEKKIADVRNNG